MSRVSKSLKNAKVGAFFFLLSIFAQFFSRKIFLGYLGDEFIGLTSTLRSILGFLTLAELGIGTAIGYALYKPIFENNHSEVNKIIALLGFLYKKIGYFILSAGILVAVFFPLFFKNTNFSLTLIYFIYFSLLTSSLLSYFFNYHMTLLEADQKGYVVQVYFQSLNILRLILQGIIAYYLQSYYAWVLMELLFAICLSIILRIKIREHYPWLVLNSNQNASLIKEYPQIVSKIKQLFVHKMGSFVKDGTDNLLIYALVNIQSVTYFGNYQLVIVNLHSLIKIIFAGTGAGVGNLVAENNQRNIDKVFWEMMAIQFFLGGFFSLATYYLISPFIIIWIGEEYVLQQGTIILMIGILFINLIKSPVQFFMNAYGLFSDTWAPVFDIISNLTLSLIFGKIWGIFGVLLGTYFSLIGTYMIWKPYFLYSKGFKRNIWSYWNRFIPLTIVFAISAIIIDFIYSTFFNRNFENFFTLSFTAFKLCIIIGVVYGSLLYFSAKGFRDFVRRVINLIGRKFR